MFLPDRLTAAREVTLGKSKHGTDERPGWKVWAQWYRPDGVLRAGSVEVDLT